MGSIEWVEVNSLHSLAISPNGKRPYFHTLQVVCALRFVTMSLTDGAVRALKRGANCGSDDFNAIMDNGDKREAGQVCMEDDDEMRRRMGFDEFQPVLEVKRTVWLGRWLRPHPVIKYYCSDGGDDDICVMASPRKNFLFAKKFYSKSGPHQKGQMNVGRRFKLLDYTTGLEPRDGKFHDVDEEVVHVEKIRSMPRAKRQSKILKFLASNNARLQGDWSGRTQDDC